MQIRWEPGDQFDQGSVDLGVGATVPARQSALLRWSKKELKEIQTNDSLTLLKTTLQNGEDNFKVNYSGM